jgi:hypothetical protein
MDLQVLLLVIDRRGLSIMLHSSRTVDMEYEMETKYCWESRMGSKTSLGGLEWSGE